jgi:uncharacterized lipoprotein YddW (UPF0748 family)
MNRVNWFVAAAGLTSILLASKTGAEGFAEFRSTFVDRFDYDWTSGNIPAMTTAIQNQIGAAAQEGFTEVVWQVRGRGDALYNSNYEPPAAGLTPGFDPLQTAIDAAHSHGLKLHAWINTTPIWNTTAIDPPNDSIEHIYHRSNPSFRLTDIDGNLEPQQGWEGGYASVNPVLPEVHAHINNVVRDIAENYDVDGINLDYIRYIPGANNAAADFAHLPHDAISHQMFQQATGLNAGDIGNFGAYKQYITGRITDLVRSIKQTVDDVELSTGRSILLSADVWRDPDVGKNDYMQDYRTWIEEELLDVAMPMIYLSALNDHIFFDANLANTLSAVANSGSSTRIAPTLATYLHVDPARGGGVELTLSQMNRAFEGFGQGGADGVGFYDYPAFFTGYSNRDRRRIKSFFATIAPAEPGPGEVIDDFEADHGRFHWDHQTAGNPHTFGLADGTIISRDTSEAQSGGASQLLNLVAEPGTTNWMIRHYSGEETAGNPSDNAMISADGWVGMWLKTDDAGLLVRIGIDDPTASSPAAVERGIPLSVIADNEWHLYQWNLLDELHWEAYSGAADGFIDGTNGSVTIDSIWLAGVGDAQVHLDTVAHNPGAALETALAAAAVPGDYNADGGVDFADYSAWSESFGDGVVDAAGYVLWRKAMASGGAGGAVAAVAAPEPATGMLLLFAAAMYGAILRRGCAR